MINILADVAIEDFDKFIGAFSTRGFDARKAHGSIGSQVFKIAGEENRVIVLFEWESLAAFEGFLSNPKVKETMKSSGTTRPPVFTYLEKAAEFQG
ncbi:MAG: antibiotic biosynthesis monooxygenase [Acidobacteriota bacterium]|nr:antibiotic biosynthesis monooxygenase [Acidobacteriota bacterium]